MRNFNAKSQQFREREIRRRHRAWNYGLSVDLPKSAVPINGYTKAQNFRNVGHGMQGRRGNKLWTETGLPGSGIMRSWVAHRSQKKVVVHRGQSVYVSDSNKMSQWYEAAYIGSAIANEESVMRVYRHWIFIFCSGAIYRLNLDVDTDKYTYYRINTEVPSTKITESGSGDYKRRVLYGKCRLTGAGHRTRNTSGVTIEHESGTTQFDGDSDYAEVSTTNPVDETNTATSGNLTLPDNSEAATHFPVYTTLDLGDDAYDPISNEKNKDYVYVWNTDLPVAKAFTASVDVSGNLTITKGTLETADIGCTLESIGGDSVKIETVDSSTAGTVTDADGTPYSSGEISSTQWALGGGTVLQCSQGGAGNNVVARHAGTAFTTAMIGKQIFWADGSSSLVTGYTDADTLSTNSGEAHEQQAATHTPVSRAWTDSTEDETLRSRIGNQDLYGRFFEPITDADLGDVAFGIVMSASKRGQKIQYSEITRWYEELCGYHRPDYQEDVTEDDVYWIQALVSSFDVKCSNSTMVFWANTITQQTIQETGESFQIFTRPETTSRQIGTRASRSIAMKGDVEVLMTSEPAIREYDGRSYGPNLADQRIMSILEQIDPERVCASYDQWNGYVFWTTQPFGIEETGEATTEIDESGDRDDDVVESGTA